MDAAAITALNARIAQCTACPLAAGRTQTVPGDGDPNADILFIGVKPPAFTKIARGGPLWALPAVCSINSWPTSA